MRRIAFGAMCGLVLAAGLVAQELPAAVKTFYGDWNFIVLNSTPAERQTLWEGYLRGDSSPGSGHGREILRRLRSVNDAIEVEHGSMPTAPGLGCPVRDELLIPASGWEDRDGRILLEVDVRMIQSGRSIGSGPWPQWQPDIAQMYPRIGSYSHQWSLSGATWKLSQPDSARVAE